MGENKGGGRAVTEGTFGVKWEFSVCLNMLSSMTKAMLTPFFHRIQTWALEEARRRLEVEGILEDPFPEGEKK